MLPSLSALRHNVEYVIVSGNEEGMFDMHRKKGVSSLHFTQHISQERVFCLVIDCHPKVADEQIGDEVVHLESYKLHLEIHVDRMH